MSLLRKICLSLYSSGQRAYRNIFWYVETKKVQRLSIPKSELLPPLPVGKYLVLVPHSDDEWIGNSTIISDPKYDVILCNTNMSGGDSESFHMKRIQEMTEVAKKYERKIVHIGEDKSIDLLKAIKEFAPDYVMLPCFYDWHEEHFQVMTLLLDVEKLIRKIDFNVVMYQVTLPMPIQLITHTNLLDRELWKKKWHLFRKVYETQSNFPWYRVACVEKINGINFGCYAVEVYSSMDYVEWKSLFKKHKPSLECRKDLAVTINSIIPTKDKIIRLYESNSKLQ